MTSSTIWGASDAGPATATMRVPVDTGASSSPGQLTLGEIGTLLTGSAIAATGTVTDGKLLIGSTATSGLALATLTAGNNITITNAGGGITIAATSGGSGTVTSVATGTGLTGGAITTTGTLSLSSNALIKTIVLTVNGAGSAPSTGAQVSVTVPYACTIANWYLVADQSGSCVIDVKRSGTSIVGGGGNKPTLSSAASGNGAVSGWTSSTVSAGDIIQFNLDSVTACTWINLVLKVNLSS